jgi:hypothetical protein
VFEQQVEFLAAIVKPAADNPDIVRGNRRDGREIGLVARGE